MINKHTSASRPHHLMYHNTFTSYNHHHHINIHQSSCPNIQNTTNRAYHNLSQQKYQHNTTMKNINHA